MQVVAPLMGAYVQDWQADPWSARIDEAGFMHGLGTTDMKGPVAAAIVAARALPLSVPITLLITTDEETTKQGARLIAEKSELLRRVKPVAILVAEPTSLIPVRGHRSSIGFTCVATGAIGTSTAASTTRLVTTGGPSASVVFRNSLNLAFAFRSVHRDICFSL